MWEILNAELKSERLERIPKTLYRDLASYIKSIKNDVNQGGESVTSRLKDVERKLLYAFVTRLLEIRIEKAAKLPSGVVDEGRLTSEEKYILEALTQSDIRMNRVKEAIRSGRASLLSRISEVLASRFVVVRFLQPLPSIMGVDLKRYGPFQPGDVVAMPLENVKPLLKQGSVEEVWVEE